MRWGAPETGEHGAGRRAGRRTRPRPRARPRRRTRRAAPLSPSGKQGGARGSRARVSHTELAAHPSPAPPGSEAGRARRRPLIKWEKCVKTSLAFQRSSMSSKQFSLEPSRVHRLGFRARLARALAGWHACGQRALSRGPAVPVPQGNAGDLLPGLRDAGSAQPTPPRLRTPGPVQLLNQNRAQSGWTGPGRGSCRPKGEDGPSTRFSRAEKGTPLWPLFPTFSP